MSTQLVPMRVIAHIRTDYPQKFGIPRQSGLVSEAQGRIVFEPEFANNAAVKGLEGFSHLWLLWQFENGLPGGSAEDLAADAAASMAKSADAGDSASAGGNTSAGGNATAGGNASAATSSAASEPFSADNAFSWSPTVRPPRLGGAQRMGVFATRSPFHPNPIGLSCVRLERVEPTDAGPILHVRGADLRDRTPIFDVKPYVPYADCQPEATGGFTDQIEAPNLSIDFPTELLAKVPEEKRGALLQVLQEDPRPVGRRTAGRVYEVAYAGMRVSFTGDADELGVIAVEAL